MTTRTVEQDERGYNGWANYETWNVALWVQNDEGLYSLVSEDRIRSWDRWVETMRQYGEDCGGGAIAYQTPDGVAWNDSGLDTERLDEMLAEIVDGEA